MNSEWGQIYKSLGATPIINAIGSVTMLGGSPPVPEVKEAMELASQLVDYDISFDISLYFESLLPYIIRLFVFIFFNLLPINSCLPCP